MSDPAKRLLLLVWSMRYEWIACGLGCYLIVTAETGLEWFLAFLCFLATGLLPYVRPKF
jgi:hypothetical protein